MYYSTAYELYKSQKAAMVSQGSNAGSVAVILKPVILIDIWFAKVMNGWRSHFSDVYIWYITVTTAAAKPGINQFIHQLLRSEEQELTYNTSVKPSAERVQKGDKTQMS